MKTENLIELIKKSRPNIKDSTIKMYVGNLNKLKTIFDYYFTHGTRQG